MANDEQSGQQIVASRGRGRPRRSEGPALSRQRIVEEALRLIDRDGADALSMRKLGQYLGVEAMTLYAYVSSKDDLLDAVADQVAGELALPAVDPADWQLRIRNAVAAWSRMQTDHPGAFPLLYRRRAGTEQERAVTEEIMDALATAGFDPAEVALSYQTLVAFLDGALLHWPRSEWRADSGWQRVAAHVDAVSYPRVAEVAPLAAQLAWDDVFQAGLDLLLRGLESTLQLKRWQPGRGGGPEAAVSEGDAGT